MMARRRDENSLFDLTLRREPLDDRVASAFDAFLHEVFGFAPARSPVADPRWERWALLDDGGRCVGGLEAAPLELVLDGADAVFAALRLVGIVETHRGRGLFRDLVTRALSWCDARGPTLLYTEDPSLYTRFGFAPLAQHAFVGPAPDRAAGVRPAERIDAARARSLVDRLAPGRAPVSSQCAIRGAVDLLRAGLTEEGVSLAHAEDLDALLVYERDDEELVLADVVAPAMPTMAQIVAALGPGSLRVRTLFSPDRLDWPGAPEPDDTGLMIRGTVPAAMRRPFMLPPTTAF